MSYRINRGNKKGSFMIGSRVITSVLPPTTNLTPTNLSVTASSGVVRLTWENPSSYSQVISYVIERRISAGSWLEIENAYINTRNPLPYVYYIDEGLSDGITYEYRIATKNSSSTMSSYSDSDSVTITGTTYYVSATGTGTDDGLTTGTPWSISQVVRTYTVGDLVLFKRGDTFNTSTLSFVSRGDGTIKNPVKFSAYGAGNKPALNISGSYGLDLRDISNWDFSDLDITGPTSFTILLKAQGENISNIKFLNVDINGASHTNSFAANIHVTEQGGSNLKTSTYYVDGVEVAYCNLINAGNSSGNNDAVRLWASRKDGWIHNNVFSGNGGNDADIAGGDNHVVEYNWMTKSSKSHGQQHLLTNMVYRGNLLNGNLDTATAGISLQDSEDGIIEQNTIYMGNYCYGAIIYMGRWNPELHRNNVIDKNIIVGSRSGEGVMRFDYSSYNDNGVQLSFDPYDWKDTMTCTNNVIYDTLGYIVRIFDPYPVGTSRSETISTSQEFADSWQNDYPTDIYIDPLFTDPENGDFSLQSGSPATGLGVPEFML